MYLVRNSWCPPSRTSRKSCSRHMFFHARKLKIGKQLKNYIYLWSMMSGMTSFSNYSVRNCQSPQCTALRTGYSWHTFIHATELNLVHKSSFKYFNDPNCYEWLHPQSIQSGSMDLLYIYLGGDSWSAKGHQLFTGTKKKVQFSPKILTQMWRPKGSSQVAEGNQASARARRRIPGGGPKLLV